MASGIGTNVSVVPGDPLRIGVLSFLLFHESYLFVLLKWRGPHGKSECNSQEPRFGDPLDFLTLGHLSATREEALH